MDCETKSQLDKALELAYHLELDLPLDAIDRSLNDLFTAVREDSDHAEAWNVVSPCIKAIFNLVEHETARQIERAYKETADKFGIDITTDPDGITEWSKDAAYNLINGDTPIYVRKATLNPIIEKSVIRTIADNLGINDIYFTE